MTDVSPFFAGFALSAGLIAAIGSQNAFVLRQGLRREHVGPIVLFCTLADLMLITAGVAGVGAAFATEPELTALLALGGAAFLGLYGLAALRRAFRPQRLTADDGGAGMTLRGALATVAAITLLNPHVYLDTMLLVGSVGAAYPPKAQAPFVLGAGLASAAWFTALGFSARLLAPLFARPIVWRLLDLMIGAGMIFLCTGLIDYALGVTS